MIQPPSPIPPVPAAKKKCRSIRQQKYKRYRLSGMSAYQSARKAGYRHATAINAHKNIENRCGFDSILVKHGLDDDSLVAKLREGVDATRPVLVGKSHTLKDYADYPTRHTYIETALKLQGRLKTGASSVVVDNRSVTFNGSVDELRKIVSDMRSIEQSNVIDTDGEVL